jgi:hypothetical protein
VGLVVIGEKPFPAKQVLAQMTGWDRQTFTTMEAIRVFGHRQHADRRARRLLCGIADEADASLVVINRDPTPFDHAATAVIRDRIGQALPRLVDQLIAASRA